MDKYAYNVNHEMVQSTVGLWYKVADVEQLQTELDEVKENREGYRTANELLISKQRQLESIIVQAKEAVKSTQKKNDKLHTKLDDCKDVIAKGFNTAAEELLKPLQAKLDKYRWIPISEGPPEIKHREGVVRSDAVLILFKDKCCITACYGVIDGWCEVCKIDNEWNSGIDGVIYKQAQKDITHYMYIPELPKR